MYLKIQPDLLIGLSDLIRRFYNVYENELADLQLKTIHASILHFVADHGGLTQQEIAKVCMMQRSSISQIITDMEIEGLLHRRKDERDKRLARIDLTQEGRRKAEIIKGYFDEYCEKHFKNFTEEELELFFALVKKIDYMI